MNNNTNYIVDTHSHTKNSDGKKSTENRENKLSQTIQQNATSRVVATILDHDIITGAGAESLFTGEGVEITTYSHKLNKHAHIGLIANNFLSDPDIDKNFLGIRERKMANLKQSIDLLSSKGFNVNYIDFLNLYKGSKNLNSFQLARYVLKNKDNLKMLKNITSLKIKNDTTGIVFFMKVFLKPYGQYSTYGYNHDNITVGIEPSIVGDIAQKNNGLSILVHPHVTFKSIEEFKLMFSTYKNEYGINTIEIPTTANLKWVSAIIDISEKHNMYITFGSDSHGYKPDRTHGKFLTMNPFVYQDIINYYGSQIFEIIGPETSMAQIY